MSASIQSFIVKFVLQALKRFSLWVNNGVFSLSLAVGMINKWIKNIFGGILRYIMHVSWDTRCILFTTSSSGKGRFRDAWFGKARVFVGQNISGFALSISVHLPVNVFFVCAGLKWTLKILRLLSYQILVYGYFVERSDPYDGKILAKHQVFPSETSGT